MTLAPSEAEQPIEMDIDEQVHGLGKRRVIVVPKMLEFHTWLDNKRLQRRSCRVIGESRTGKTLNCDTYSLHRSVVQSPGQPPNLPVVYWQCPENLSVSGLFTGLLQHFHYQATRGRIPELRDRLYQVLRSCQVEMVILDEAHRISIKALSEIRDISDLLEISVVLVGTDRLNTLLGQDEQNRYRFLASYRFTRLTAEELQDMTALWEEHVLQMPEASKLTSPKAQNMLLQATQGYIGLLDQILCEAATRAIRKGQPQIGLDLLKEAIVECS
jgi:DNA transposition AAA+ family ATPase